MIHTTKGIVLRTIKYGETSVIVSIFTELFGVQSYLVNGVRSSSKSAQGKAGMYTPGAILEMAVYHNDLKNLQRIKEARWSYLYKEVFFDVKKNAVCLFLVELLQKCLKQPEPLPDLFYFSEDVLTELDTAAPNETANIPLFAALHISSFLGHRITDNYSTLNPYLDLKEGQFFPEPPVHGGYVPPPYSEVIAEFLRTRQPAELNDLLLNREQRNVLMRAVLDFYVLHQVDFGTMRSLEVLQAVMGV